MNRHSGFLWLALLLTLTGYTQTNRYIISFKNKNNSPFSLNTPLSYLSQKSVDRRLRYQIGLDSTDLPVNPAYIDSIRLAGNVVILNKSKWLNSVSILTTDAAALAKINSFSFVKSVTTIAPRMAN